jgi:hypothetical protein
MQVVFLSGKLFRGGYHNSTVEKKTKCVRKAAGLKGLAVPIVKQKIKV